MLINYEPKDRDPLLHSVAHRSMNWRIYMSLNQEFLEAVEALNEVMNKIETENQTPEEDTDDEPDPIF